MKRERELRWTFALLSYGLLTACGAAASSPEDVAAGSSDLQLDKRGEFNRPGNILIADQFNNRAIEIDRAGDVVWHFGLGPNDLSARSIIGVNDAERVGTLTLLSGTGAPPGTEPACPDAVNGCADNRVILVDEDDRIVWQYGQFGVSGAGPNQLVAPVQATFLPNRHVLITDQGNQRVIEVSIASGNIVWQYGTTGVGGDGPDQLDDPNSAELLENGHILISDENNNRVIEVNRRKKIVATFSAGGTVSGVAFSSRLANGDTLITDSNNSRIVEVDKSDHVVWQYFTNTDANSNPSPLPTRAVRLENGNTLISDQFNHRVIAVDHSGKIVASYGAENVAGFDRKNVKGGGLNAPYDAKVVGDYTGLTPPIGHDFD